LTHYTRGELQQDQVEVRFFVKHARVARRGAIDGVDLREELHGIRFSIWEI
jgi:hypothetical protein